jgi:eukaryotic-like serine/threonine-protein kinase
VAAALPGGDPLAAALAAGETPSPEMVAAAGERTAFNPALGLSLFAVVIVGLITIAILSDRVFLIARIPLEKSVDTLEDRAKEIITSLGFKDKPVDTARGILGLGDYLLYVQRTDRSATRWSGLDNPYFPTLRFWYRTSPRDLEPNAPIWRPGFDDPPLNVTNMRLVVTDLAGHLTQFTNVPPQREDLPENAPQPSMDWSLFFNAAGLDMSMFKPVPSTWVPNTYADERVAWEGPMPGRSDITLHADAASYRGQPAFFQIAGPWSRTQRQTQEVQQGRTLIRFLLFLIVFGLSVGTCVLAWNNYKSGRGDHRGASRLATGWLILYFCSWLIGARFWLEPLTEFNHFLSEFAAVELLEAAMIWLVYMALEPYVRKYSADILMSWSRLLSGRIRDPRVGRDVLVGIVAGLTIAVVGSLVALLPGWLGYPPTSPRGTNLELIMSTRRAVSWLLRLPTNALANGMIITLLFALVRMVVKRTWIATIVTIVVGTFVVVAQNPTLLLWIVGAYGLVLSIVYIGVLVRFGMFPLMMAYLTNTIVSNGLTADVNKLYAPTSVWLMVLVVAMSAFGFYASRAGEPLFGKTAT